MTDVADALAASPLLGSLDAVALRRLARSSATEIVHAGDVLVRRGESADGLFLVLAGRLAAEDEDGLPLAEHSAGDVVGELGMLTGRRRAATVRAIRDSHVVRVPSEAFERLLHDRPEVARRLSAEVAQRLSASPPRRRPRGTVIALLPAGGTSPALVTEVVRLLLAEIGPRRTRRVSRASVQRAVGRDAAPSELLAHLHRIEQGVDAVLLEAGDDVEWAHWCVRQADEVVLVADAAAAPDPSPGEVEVSASSRLRSRLLLVHDDDQPSVGSAATWAERRDVRHVLHLPLHDPASASRAARELTGRSVGVVLGGGGPRGFAHLGVLRALEEAGIPIDVVGGTSIGAVMAAGFARGWDHETRLAQAIAAFGRRRIIRPGVAGVALASSSRITAMLRDPDRFGGLDVVDLPRRFFCVSTNLTQGRAVVHDSGPLWRALRASISMPGILAPVFDDGDLLVDGAAIDNLPVGAMRDRGVGAVLAVDVSPEADVRVVAPFDADAPAWRLLRRRIRDRRLPGAVDVLLQAKALGGRIAQRDARLAAPPDLLFTPPVDGVGLLDFRRALGLVDDGYRYASEVLAATPWPDGRT